MLYLVWFLAPRSPRPLSGIASSKWVRDCIQGGKYGFALPAVMVLKEVRRFRVLLPSALPRKKAYCLLPCAHP